MANELSFITPSYRGDLLRCRALFESLDRFAHSYRRHYVIVHDEDYALFAPFAGPKREILPASKFLPPWLHPLPGFVRWRGRRYLWSFRGRPIYGWHTQQMVKIAATLALPEQRFCLIDSDNVLFRPFDVAPLAEAEKIRLFVTPGGVDASQPRHGNWVAVAHDILGLKTPDLPTDDYIGQMIIWDKDAVRAMVSRIEATTGRGWAHALVRANSFSEYMIYGTFVTNDPVQRARHVPTADSFCQAYWDLPAPDMALVTGLLRSSAPHQVAVCVQSFHNTSPEMVLSAIAAYCAEKPGIAAVHPA